MLGASLDRLAPGVIQSIVAQIGNATSSSTARGATTYQHAAVEPHTQVLHFSFRKLGLPQWLSAWIARSLVATGTFGTTRSLSARVSRR